jgi:glyoxylase-like metal-dependent hydrolase (beta-lactamase superfamily II)
MQYNITMPVFIYIILLGLVNFYTTAGLAAQTASKTDFNVITYQSSPEGFMSNSHIIIGENEAILIDAQFSQVEGKKVAELIKSTGKKLTKILITHPHPDHYYGLEVLGVEFSDAEILGGPQTIEGVKNTAKYWKDNEGGPPTLGKMTVLGDKGFKYEDISLTFRIFRNGESVENTVIYIPSSKTLFIGDLASNNVHMWIGENNIDKWLEQLRSIRSIGSISSVYPGHGLVGTADILERAEEYLLNFKESVNNSETINDAVKKMKKLYPDYEMPEILEGSIRSVMWAPDKK